MFTCTITSNKAVRMCQRLIRAFSTRAVDKVVEKVARTTNNELRKATPPLNPRWKHKWTGTTKNGWRVEQRAPGQWQTTNDTEGINYLVRGAKGPITPKKAKRLFVPLTMRGKMFYGGGMKLEYGVDFLLLKKVRGRAPKPIVADELPKAKMRFNAAMRSYLRESLRKSIT